MFVNEHDSVSIKVYWRAKGYTYEALTERELAQIEESKRGNYECLTIEMRKMTWGLYNELQESALVPDGQGERYFNYKKYKENRLIKLIKNWDAKNDEGKSVSISEPSIKKIAWEVGEAILRAHDEVSFVSEEEEKK